MISEIVVVAHGIGSEGPILSGIIIWQNHDELAAMTNYVIYLTYDQ